MEENALEILALTALSPLIVALVYLVQLRPGRGVGWKPALRAVGAGLLALAIAGIASLPWTLVEPRLTGWTRAFVIAFVAAGFQEEAAKGMPLLGLCLRHEPGRTRQRAMFLGLIVGLTFGFVESVCYAFMVPDDEALTSGQLAYVRALLSTPMHGFATGLFAYYMAEGPRPRRLLGLAWAVGLHGGFDFVLMSPGGVLAPFVLLLALADVCAFQWHWWRGERLDARDREQAASRAARAPGSGRLGRAPTGPLQSGPLAADHGVRRDSP
jgi:RsiW-degrading membrane proteinase PrsW (M82 family)